MGVDPSDELLRSISHLLDTGTYSDVTIITAKDEFKVHKAIICPRSLFFQKACDNVAFEEANTGTIKLLDDEPLCVKLMIHHFYRLDYEWNIEVEPSSKNSSDKPSMSTGLLTHAKMYALGEKYGIMGLKTLSLKKFTVALQDHYNSDELERAIEEVYTSTVSSDRGMRDAVVKTLGRHPELLDKDELQAIAKESALGFDLMMKFREQSMMPNNNNKEEEEASSYYHINQYGSRW